MIRSRVSSFLLVPFFALLVFLPLKSVSAAEIVVTTFDDLIGDDGVCSLREAVINANANAQVTDCAAGEAAVVDVIVLSAGTYNLTRSCDDYDDDSGFGEDCDDLEIVDNTIVRGAGKDLTTIMVGGVIPNGGYGYGNFRIFSLYALGNFQNQGYCEGNCTETKLTVEDMTLAGGSECEGGAIFTGSESSCGYPNLELNRTRLTNNMAYCAGGAIYSVGLMSITDSEIDENQAYGDGGGIFARSSYQIQFGCDGETTVDIADSAITENFAFGGSGGGLSVAELVVSTLTGSSVTGNGAYVAGGGIANSYSSMTITGSTISDNGGVPGIPSGEGNPDQPELYGPLFGGGIFNVASPFGFFAGEAVEGDGETHALRVEDSTVSGNSALLTGGGISNHGFEFGCERMGSVIGARNVSLENLLGFCGIDNYGAQDFEAEIPSDVYVDGSTVSGNTALFGGGIHHAVFTGEFHVNNSTISDNLAVLGGGILNRWVMAVNASTLSGNQAVFVIENDNPELPLMSAQVEEEPSLIPITLGGGGGMLNAGSAVLTNTTISGNSTHGSGAGVLNLTGPLYYIFYLITNPDLFENPDASPSPTGTPFGDAGEGYEFEPLPRPGTALRNVTVTGNEIVELPIDEQEQFESTSGIDIDGITLVSNGGGIATYLGDISVRNSIIAGNSDNQENIDIFFDDFVVEPSPTPTPSPDPDEPFFGDAADFAPDCYQFQNFLGVLCEYILDGSGFEDIEGICQPWVPSITSEFYNLIGDNTGCDPFTPENGEEDQVGTGDSPIDPLLGSLSDNGGPTLTHYLLQGSSAIDRANPTGSFSTLVDGEEDFAVEANDQIGTARSLDGDLDNIARGDIGAVEVIVDCSGVPGGSAVLDECGICDGDGSFCAPTPTPTPDVNPDVQCEEVDVSSQLFALDGLGLRQDAVNRQIAQTVKRAGGGRSGKLLRRSKQLYLEFWGATWQINTIQNLNCTGAVESLCVEVSNASSIDTVRTNSQALKDIASKLLRRAKRAGVNQRHIRRFRQAADDLLAEANGAIMGVPASSSQCNISA